MKNTNTWGSANTDPIPVNHSNESRRTLEELRTDLWKALANDNRALAEEALRHFDEVGGALGALLIENGGELSFGDEAWQEYRSRIGNLRLHLSTQKVEGRSVCTMRLTDRKDRLITA